MRPHPTLSSSLVLGLALLAAKAAADASPPPAADLVIHGARLISPERPRILEDAWVAIRDGRIEAVGSGDGGPPAATRVDAGGRFLVPGLIDGHVHLAAVPGMPLPPSEELAPLAAAYEEQLPRSYLYFGFTTVVDLNVVDRAFVERVRAADFGPDVYDCGGALALANGYPMVFLPGEAGFDSHPNFLWDPRHADRIPSRFRPEDHTPAAAVERVAAGGGICVKAHFEDGFGPAKTWPTPTPEMIAGVIAASRSRDLTVTLHANSFEAHRFAAGAGADVIVHGMWNWDGLRAAGGELPEPIRKLLDDVVEREIGVMPTIRVLTGLQSLFDPGFLDDPRLEAVLPAALIDWYRSQAGGWFREELRRDFGGLADDRVRAGIQGGADQGAMVVRYLAEHGGRLLFGSDTPSAPTYGNPPGYNGFLEIRALAAAGMSPRRILRAATLDVAEAFRLDDRYGSVTPGKIANLLLLDENPLESVEAYDTLDTVILRGRPVAREELEAGE